MAYLTWLADALRAGGCNVIEQAGWKSRGHGSMGDVRGVLCHHTGGGGSNDWSVVQNGRAGLAGPLAHLTLERNGTFRVIAAGQCWHAGTGGPLMGAPRNAGNTYLIGIEGVSNGTTWTAEQRAAYPKGVAAILRHLRLGADRCAGHKEWAPGRKPDPGNWDMSQFRRTVAEHLGGVAPSPGAPNGGGPRSLHRGDKGDDVKVLQQRLKSAYAAYAGNLVVDGDFGPATEAAVKEFQRRSKLTADGVVGGATRAALRL